MSWFSVRIAGVGKSSRVFLKYAANFTALLTRTRSEEKADTMIEAGFGPHVRF